MNRLSLARSLILLVFVLAPAIGAPAREYVRPGRPQAVRSDRSPAAKRLAKVVKIVEHSNALNLIGQKRWRRLLTQHRDAIEQSRTHTAFAGAINDLFESTGQSHFKYFTDQDWLYWLLRGFFFQDEEIVEVEHIGLFTERIGGRWFVRSLLEESAATSTMIRVGDEVLSVDGLPFSPVNSFRGKAGQSVRIRLRRKPGLVFNLSMTPVKESLYDAMQKAIQRSIRVIEHDGFDMAYMHGWSLLGRGTEYRRLLDMQADVDGLILDYRDGVGGLPDAAKWFVLGDGGRRSRHRRSSHWTKPVVILTADGTRSGKEVVVHAVQSARRAPLIGEPTPGSVTGATARRVGRDGLLILPVMRSSLEGKPTLPDIHVGRDIRYCAGSDPQLAVGKMMLAHLIRWAQGRRSHNIRRTWAVHLAQATVPPSWASRDRTCAGCPIPHRLSQPPLPSRPPLPRDRLAGAYS